MIEQPTRITNHSATRIDLLFSNKVERITKTYNFLTGLSDHNIIFFSRKLSKQRFSKTQPQQTISTVPKNLQPSFEDALRRLEWDDFYTCDDIELGCNVLLSKINNVIESFTRRGRQRKGQKVNLPWIDENCRALMKKRDLLLKQSLKSGLTTDRQRFSRGRNQVTHLL